MPQGSVLGPILFIIYINDLEQGLTSKISKFADDTKLGKGITSDADISNLQKELDELANWSIR